MHHLQNESDSDSSENHTLLKQIPLDSIPIFPIIPTTTTTNTITATVTAIETKIKIEDDSFVDKQSKTSLKKNKTTKNKFFQEKKN